MAGTWPRNAEIALVDESLLKLLGLCETSYTTIYVWMSSLPAIKRLSVAWLLTYLA